VTIAKNIIEKKYKMKKVQEEDRRRGLIIVRIDWDFLTKELKDMKVSDKEAENIKKAIHSKESEFARMKYYSKLIKTTKNNYKRL